MLNALAEKLTTVLFESEGSLSVREHRLRAPEQLIHESMSKVDVNLCSNCIASIQSLLAQAVRLENMIV